MFAMYIVVIDARILVLYCVISCQQMEFYSEFHFKFLKNFVRKSNFKEAGIVFSAAASRENGSEFNIHMRSKMYGVNPL